MDKVERKDYYCPHCDEMIDKASWNFIYRRLINMMRKKRQEDKTIIKSLKEEIETLKTKISKMELSD